MSFYSDYELAQQGFASVGGNAQISRFATFYGRSPRLSSPEFLIIPQLDVLTDL